MKDRAPLTVEEFEIVDAEIALVRSALGRRRPSFPFLGHHGAVSRRLSRGSRRISRSEAADLLTEWARLREDMRLVVYVPVVAALGRELPPELDHAARVVERNGSFEEWARNRLKSSPPVPTSGSGAGAGFDEHGQAAG